MAKDYRGLRTPGNIYPTYGKTERRIIIPQSPYRPVTIQPSTVVKKEKKTPPWWYVEHRRFRRPNVGDDQREARAVPTWQVRGTLPERILYKALRDLMHLAPDSEFDFQTALQGGRLEMGGLSVDFIIYPYTEKKFAINVQGSTHDQFLRRAKDREQRDVLKDMGYELYEIDEDTIYDEYKLDDALRQIFNLGGGGSAYGSYNADATMTYSGEYMDYESNLASVRDVLYYILDQLEEYRSHGTAKKRQRVIYRPPIIIRKEPILFMRPT